MAAASRSHDAQLQVMQRLTGERPPLAPWPAPLALAPAELAAVMREAGYEEASVRAAAAASLEQSSDRLPSAREPAAIRPRVRFSDPLPPSRALDWGNHYDSLLQILSGLPPAAAASASSPSTTSATASSSAAAASSSPQLGSLNYDLFLGHVTHLYRGSLQLQRLIMQKNKQSAASQQRKYEVCFIDPFGTSMMLQAQPWQLLGDFSQQLQAYIPQHLKSWCKIGIRRGNTDDASPSSRLQNSAFSPIASASSIAPSPLLLPGIEPLNEALSRHTLAHAKLVDSDAKWSPIKTADPIEAQASLSSAFSPSTASSAASSSALVSYGEVCVVLRNDLPGFTPLASSSSSSSAAAAPSPSAAIHTFNVQVFGLDLLSDVLARVRQHVALTYAWQMGQVRLHSLKRPFSLPLQHLPSPSACDDCVQLEEQQTVFSAQLASEQQLLLVEVLQCDGNAGRPLRLTVRSLTGKAVELSVHGHELVRELKQRLAAHDGQSLPPAQQKLLFDLTTLEDERTLASYGIVDGSSLQLLLKLREPNPSGFRMQCGRAGLNPLSSESPASVDLLHAVMSWSLPPRSKLRSMQPDLLVSLLVHTRRLLCDTHAHVHSQQLYGHSSKGKAWIDEKQIRVEVEHAASAIDGAGDSAAAQDLNDDADVAVTGVKRSASAPSTTGGVIDLTDADEVDAAADAAMRRSFERASDDDDVQPLALRPLPSVVPPPARRRRLVDVAASYHRAASTPAAASLARS